MKHTHPVWLLMIPLLLLSAGVAASRLNADAVWYDEERTYQKVGGGRYEPLRTPEEIVNYTIRFRDSWPPLYNFTFAGWGQVTGWTPYAHRAMALLFGMLSLAAVYRLGVDLARTTGQPQNAALVGLTAALILGTAAFYLHYWHEMRGYTMSVFFALMSLTLYWRLSHGRGGPAVMAAFVIFNGLLLYTHYITAFLLGGVGLYHLLFAEKNRRWVIVLGLLAASALTILPWFGALTTVVSGESRSSRGLETGVVLLAMLRGYGNGLWVVMPAMLLLAALRERTRAALYLWTIAIVFLILSIAANYPLDYLLHIRHTMGLLPVLATLAAMGVAGLFQSSAQARSLAGSGAIIVGTLLLGTWVGAGLWNSYDRTFMNALPGHEYVIPGPTLDTMLTLADECLTDADHTVFYLSDDFRIEFVNDLPLLHYLWTDYPFDYALLRKLRHIPETYILQQGSRIRTEEPDDYTERVRAYAADAERVWLFKLPQLPRDPFVPQFEAALRQQYNTCDQVIDRDDISVYVWNITGAPLSCPALQSAALSTCTGDIVTESLP